MFVELPPGPAFCHCYVCQQEVFDPHASTCTRAQTWLRHFFRSNLGELLKIVVTVLVSFAIGFSALKDQVDDATIQVATLGSQLAVGLVQMGSLQAQIGPLTQEVKQINSTLNSLELNSLLSTIATLNATASRLQTAFALMNVSLAHVVTISGTIVPFAGDSPADGWLMCYGQEVSRITYDRLYDAIGETFGAGDGLTTFNLPDLRGRAMFGADNMGGEAAGVLGGGATGGLTDAAILGASGGEQNHILTTDELAAHTHAVSDPGHSHGMDSFIGLAGTGGTAYVGDSSGFGVANLHITRGSATGITNQPTGKNSPHNNLPPALVMNFIIKV